MWPEDVGALNRVHPGCWFGCGSTGHHVGEVLGNHTTTTMDRQERSGSKAKGALPLRMAQPSSSGRNRTCGGEHLAPGRTIPALCTQGDSPTHAVGSCARRTHTNEGTLWPKVT